MEGKEVRFGIANSALWATATTAASNGSVNSMHDSFTPLGGLVPMWLMQLGEVIFGGVGSGLYGMLMFAIVAVFIAGLMVGRTPEYLGKKIEAYEMKMASLVILIPLCGRADRHGGRRDRAEPAKPTIFNPGAHGFSEVLYAFSSAGNNNGSAFAGLSANTPFYNTLLGLAMFVGPLLADDSRCWPSPARWRRRRYARQQPARCRRTRRCSSCCWSSVVHRRRRADVHSGAGAGADRRTFADDLTVAQSRIQRKQLQTMSTMSKARPLFDPPIVRRAHRGFVRASSTRGTRSAIR